MAKIENGLFGGFTGKLGNVAGYRYKGQYCLRQATQRIKSAEPTPAQRAQQAKFAIARTFVQGFQALLQQMPPQGKRRISAFSNTFGHMLRHGVCGDYPEFSIDYPSLNFGFGTIRESNCFQAVAQPMRIKFTADLSSWAHRYSFVSVLAFNVTKQIWVFDTLDVYTLDEGVFLELPACFAGDQVETWMLLSTEQFKSQSPCIYTGSHTIPGRVPCSLNLQNPCH